MFVEGLLTQHKCYSKFVVLVLSGPGSGEASRRVGDLGRNNLNLRTLKQCLWKDC